MNDTYKKIGDRVKHYRTNRGMSQEQLADGICSRQTISLLENGQHFPSADFMKQIAVKLAVPFHEIMVDEAKELEAKVQLDIIKVYVETGDYPNAFSLIEELEGNEELLEYQRRDLVLSKAECLMRTRNEDQAVEILTDLQQRLELVRETDDHFMATLYDKLGTAFFFQSNYTNAHAHYLRAYQLTLRFPELDIVAARVAFNLGMTCRQLNRQHDAVEYLSKAETFFKDYSDVKRLAHVLFELGIAYRYRNELEQADQYLQESLALYKSLNMLYMVNHVKQNHAFIVLAKSNPEHAIRVLQDCAMEFENAGDLVRVAYTYAFIASILISEGRLSEAERNLNLALTMFSESDAQNEPRLAYVYQVNAMHLLSIKSFERSIEYSFKASEFFDKIGLGREAADSLKISAKAYRQLGMLEQAYDIAEQVNEILCKINDQFSSRLGAF